MAFTFRDEIDESGDIVRVGTQTRGSSHLKGIPGAIGGIKASGLTPLDSFEHLLTLMQLKTEDGEIGGYFDTILDEFYQENPDALNRAIVEKELTELATTHLMNIWVESGSPYIKAIDFAEDFYEDPFYAQQEEWYKDMYSLDDFYWSDYRPSYQFAKDFLSNDPDTLEIQGKYGDYKNLKKEEELLAEMPDYMSPWEWSNLIHDEGWVYGGPPVAFPEEVLSDFFAELAHAYQFNTTDAPMLRRIYTNAMAGVAALQKKGPRGKGEAVYNMPEVRVFGSGLLDESFGGPHTSVEWHAHSDPDNPYGEMQLNQRWEEMITDYLKQLEQ
tara:strand:- start:112 stop:1095 length:984 start_codon:yes stop_codon:yes gene_type:complete